MLKRTGAVLLDAGWSMTLAAAKAYRSDFAALEQPSLCQLEQHR